MVKEAKTALCPISAHAGSDCAIEMAANAGVTSIEHGNEASGRGLAAMKAHGVIFVPTLAAIEVIAPDLVPNSMAITMKAYEMGIKLACGGDTGTFAHGKNIREAELMLASGIPLEEVLTAVTLNGWEACGGDWCGRRFGIWEKGAAADIIAVDGDLRENFELLRNPSFVMKDGKVYKQNGIPEL
jgi:imidazolonepropionase-like amidohydrolase